MKEITKSWLKSQGACGENYPWLEKQKDKSVPSIANQLYKEKKYDWCLWLLYRKTITARIYVWLFLLLSSALLGLSFYLSRLRPNSEVVVATVAVVTVAVVAAVVTIAVAVAGAAVAVAVAIAVAGGAAVAVTAFGTAGIAITGVAVAGIAVIAFGIAVAAVDVAAVAAKNNIFLKLGCKLSIKEVESLGSQKRG